MPDLSQIVPPRIPLVDARTGMIAREWYLFFLSIFEITNDSSELLDGLQKIPPALTVDETVSLVNKAGEDLAPSQSDILAQIDELWKSVSSLHSESSQGHLLSRIDELHKDIQALQVTPQFDIGAIVAAINGLSSDPVVKTTDFTVQLDDKWLINNKSGSSCVVTLPGANTCTGRELHFQNYQNQTLVSNSSNVVPLAGGSAGTLILQSVAGANATLVSNGVSWVMTKYDSNNSLELE